MFLQESLSLATLIVTVYCLLSVRMIKSEMAHTKAIPFFILFYLGALLMFVLLGLQLVSGYRYHPFLLDLASGLFATGFALGICRRNQASKLFYVILVAAFVYAVIVFLTDKKVQPAYLLVIIANSIATISIMLKRHVANIADKGIAATQSAFSIVLLLEVSRLPIVLDIEQYLSMYLNDVLIFLPAYISGVTILLISSYMLDANKKLADLAAYDPLTGLLNRRSLFKAAENHLSRLKRTNGNSSLIIADLDHFKSVNDNYGHNIGDKVIRTFADTIMHSLRDYDLAARYGGEEFLIFLPDTELKHALTVANRIRLSQERRSIETDSKIISVTASFGVCQVSQELDLEANIGVADKRLYMAKDAGRNCIVPHE